MTIVGVVIKFITTYQLSYQCSLGMRLCGCCCCCSSSEVTSPLQPHLLVPLIAVSSQLLSQYSNQKLHEYTQVARFAPGPICPTLPYSSSSHFLKLLLSMYEVKRETMRGETISTLVFVTFFCSLTLTIGCNNNPAAVSTPPPCDTAMNEYCISYLRWVLKMLTAHC